MSKRVAASVLFVTPVRFDLWSVARTVARSRLKGPVKVALCESKSSVKIKNHKPVERPRALRMLSA